jgi:hypothetical protein
MQASAAIPEIEMPERDTEQHCLKCTQVRFFEHSASCRRDLEVSLVFSEQHAKLRNVTNKIER